MAHPIWNTWMEQPLARKYKFTSLKEGIMGWFPLLTNIPTWYLHYTPIIPSVYPTKNHQSCRVNPQTECRSCPREQPWVSTTLPNLSSQNKPFHHPSIHQAVTQCRAAFRTPHRGEPAAAGNHLQESLTTPEVDVDRSWPIWSHGEILGKSSAEKMGEYLGWMKFENVDSTEQLTEMEIAISVRCWLHVYVKTKPHVSNQSEHIACKGFENIQY
jgi:hypothetical protein